MPETDTIRDTAHEWEVTCPNCGVFIVHQKGDPLSCPKCGEGDIDTLPCV